MAAATLESLPAEILLQICEYLDRNHIGSVAAFARASKYCYFAVTALLFRTIRLDVSSDILLSKDVQEFHNMLQRSGSFGHVRRLLVDTVPLSADDELDHHNQRHKRQIIPEERGCSDAVLCWASGTEPTFYETVSDWEPLANLVEQLPSLQDLIYGCTSPFPPCVLLVLHRRRQCRLHISRFKLHSLNAPVTDADEFMLMSSPSLSSIELGYDTGAMAFGLPSYEHEAAMRLIRGLAPNLKEVHLFDHRYSTYISDGTPSQPWKGFTLDNDKHSSLRGLLQCLEFSSLEGIAIQLVKDWWASTDFSVLKTLKLGDKLQRDAAEFLTTNCSFPSLANLSLHLHAPYSSDPSGTKDYYDSVNRFLCSLPPLGTLHIFGVDVPQTTRDTALGHHGSSLHKLDLSYQQIAAGDVLQRFLEDIRDYCPLLEDLNLSIPRSRGDATEVALYKTLGSIPRLQRLILQLEASYRSEDCTHDDFYKYSGEEPILPVYPTNYYIRRNNHTQDALINCAVDEPLVREIFWAIASGKPGGTSALDELTVFTKWQCAPRHGQTSSLPTVIKTLAGGWEVKRNPRGNSPQDLIVEDLRYLGEADDSPLDPFLEPMFRELWPAKHNEGGNWRDDWSGRPLFKPDT
ncbi:hypothetical protein V492_01420 [Pseudogymnoascus sp. VKM F-4246]|nr:hypothetical protein V492_01420 [Pseudogymnoascus sp. VKM F-4246]